MLESYAAPLREAAYDGIIISLCVGSSVRAILPQPQSKTTRFAESGIFIPSREPTSQRRDVGHPADRLRED